MGFNIDFTTSSAHTKVGNLADAVERVGDKAIEASGKLQGMGASAAEIKAIAAEMNGAAKQMQEFVAKSSQIGKVTEEIRRTGREAQTTSDKIKKATQTTTASTKAFKGLASALGMTTKAQGEATKAQEAAAEAASAQEVLQKKIRAGMLGVARAAKQQTASVTEMAAANRSATATTQELTVASTKLAGVLGMNAKADILRKANASGKALKERLIAERELAHAIRDAYAEEERRNTLQKKVQAGMLGVTNAAKQQTASVTEMAAANRNATATTKELIAASTHLAGVLGMNAKADILRKANASGKALKERLIAERELAHAIRDAYAEEERRNTLQKKIRAGMLGVTSAAKGQTVSVTEMAAANRNATAATEGLIAASTHLAGALGMNAKADILRKANASGAALRDRIIAERELSHAISAAYKEEDRRNQLQAKIRAGMLGTTAVIDGQTKSLKELAAANTAASKAALERMIADKKAAGIAHTPVTTGAALGMRQPSVVTPPANKGRWQSFKEWAGIGSAIESETKQASRGIKKLNGHMHDSDKQSAALRAGLNSLGTHMGIFTGRTIVVASVVYSTVAALRSMLVIGSDFTKEMIRATSVMGANAEQSKQLEDKVRSLAATTIFTAGEVAQGLTFLGMAGLSSDEALQALEPTLNIAKIGMITFAEAADITTNVLRAFRLEPEQLVDVADDLATAITSSNATIKQLANSLSYVGPIAAAAGGSVREVVSILSVMHDVGIKASRAGTALRRAYSNLMAPTGKVSKALTRLNVNVTDGNGNMRALSHILVDVANSGATAGDIVQLFGVRAAAAMTSVVNDIRSANPKLKEMLDLLDNNKGAAKDLGEAFEQYLGADARKLISALHEKFIQMFKINEKSFRAFVIELKRFIEGLNANALATFVDYLRGIASVLADNAGIVAAVAAFTIFATTIRLVNSLLYSGIKVFYDIGKAMTQWGRVAGGAATATGVLGTALGKLGTALKWLGGPWMKVATWVVSFGLGIWATTSALAGNTEETLNNYEATKKLVEEKAKLAKLADPNFNVKAFKSDLLLGYENPRGYGVEGTQRKQEIDQLRKDIAQQDQVVAEAKLAIPGIYKKIAEMEASARKAMSGNVPGDSLRLEMATQGIRHAEAEIEKSSNAIIQATFKRRELQEQLDFYLKHNTSATGMQNRANLNDRIVKIYDKDNFDFALKQLKKGVGEIQSVNKEMESIGAREPKIVAKNIQAAAGRAIAVAKSKYEAEIAPYIQLENEMLAKLGAKRGEALEVIDIAPDGSKLYQGGVTQDGVDQLSEAVEKQREIGEKYKSFVGEMREISRSASADMFSNLFSDAGFDSAVEDLQTYNSKLTETHSGLQAKISESESILRVNSKQMVKGAAAADLFKDKTEQLALKTAQLNIQKQTEAMLDVPASTSPEKLKHMRKRLDLLIAEEAQLSDNIAKNEEARKTLRDLTEQVKRYNELKRRRFEFLPEDVGQKENYDHSVKDLADYYIIVEGLDAAKLKRHSELLEQMRQLDNDYYRNMHNNGVVDLQAYATHMEMKKSLAQELSDLTGSLTDEQLDQHQAFLEAKAELDRDYYWTQHELMNEMFTQLEQNLNNSIANVLLYGESWQTVLDNIGVMIVKVLLNQIIEAGVQMMRNAIADSTNTKRKQIELATNTKVEIAGIAAITKAKVAADAIATKSSMAAAASVGATVTAMTTAAGTLATAWTAPATLASIATQGGAAIAGSAAITTALGAVAGVVAASQAAGGGAGAAGAAVGARAEGGPVQANQPYLVGERGMELFVPTQAGTVVSNKDMSKATPFGGSGGGGDEEGGNNVRIINAIDPEFIDDYISSREGERVILNLLRKNKGRF